MKARKKKAAASTWLEDRPYTTDYSGNGGMWQGHCLTAQNAMEAAFKRVIRMGDKATVTYRGRDISRMHPAMKGSVTVGVNVWSYDNVVAKPRKTILRRVK